MISETLRLKFLHLKGLLNDSSGSVAAPAAATAPAAAPPAAAAAAFPLPPQNAASDSVAAPASAVLPLPTQCLSTHPPPPSKFSNDQRSAESPRSLNFGCQGSADASSSVKRPTYVNVNLGSTISSTTTPVRRLQRFVSPASQATIREALELNRCMQVSRVVFRVPLHCFL
jgi:hypothetical protein